MFLTLWKTFKHPVRWHGGVLAMGLLAMGPVSCGGSATSAPRIAAKSSAAASRFDKVLYVSPEFGPVDADDYPIINFGHRVSPAQLHRATALVKHYYAIAASENGARACSLLFPATATEVVQERDDWYVQGHTCAAVMSAIFRKRHKTIAADQRKLTILELRSDGINGRMLLRFAPGAPARELELRLVKGKWEVKFPLDVPMP